MAEVTSLNELFDPYHTTLSADVLNELHTIVRQHSPPTQELSYKWESYVIKMGMFTTKMDYKTVKDFKKDLLDTLERE